MKGWSRLFRSTPGSQNPTASATPAAVASPPSRPAATARTNNGEVVVTSWQQTLSVQTLAFDPAIRVALDERSATSLSPAVRLISVPLFNECLPASSLTFTTTGLKVSSFRFAQPAAWHGALAAAVGETTPAPSTPSAGTEKPKALTRIKPPGDVIKLEDRLHYVLQPSLESLLADGSLAFPVPAVSVPVRGRGVSLSAARGDPGRRDGPGQNDAGHHRHPAAAPLAARRNSVLLVCPKPLVTNWQREFALWAPEVPRDGDRRRPGQAAAGNGSCPTPGARSPTTNCCCATANWLPSWACISTWSCSTKSQRIKNRASATSEVRPLDLPRRRSWALTGTPVENSPRTWWASSSSSRPASSRREMKPRSDGPRGQRLRAAPHQGPGAHRPAAEAVPRRPTSS